ncbi:coiled-coil domain-containing protein 87 [Platysternon megacephalum]|uniref:Coiled-coil domain-containing protein 87 n=1 Tax=Platysternon megacephalum TaxID=55544 RepID=A0A4D9EPU7_9SAUR|nr:coiled-coil domain-containing protein 87 [Platysternon megacephalum]
MRPGWAVRRPVAGVLCCRGPGGDDAQARVPGPALSTLAGRGRSPGSSPRQALPRSSEAAPAIAGARWLQTRLHGPEPRLPPASLQPGPWVSVASGAGGSRPEQRLFLAPRRHFALRIRNGRLAG